MKGLTILFFSAFALVNLSIAQSKSDKMYDAFLDKDGVTNLSFSKNMTDIINIDLDENGEERNVTGDLPVHNLNMFF